MRHTKSYFLRLDIFQKASRVLLVFFLLVAFFARGWSLGVNGYILIFGSLIVFGIGSILKTVKAEDLTNYLSKVRTDFESEVRKELKSFRTYDYAVLHAYSKEKAYLARTLGNRLLYPVCINMIFVITPDGVELAYKELSLYEKRKPILQHMTFDPKDLRFETLHFEGDAEMMEVNVYNGEELLFSLYVRDDHLWKHFVPYMEKTVSITEKNT